MSIGPILVFGSANHCMVDVVDLKSGKSIGNVVDLIAQPHELTPDPIRRVVYLSHTYHSGGYSTHGPQCHEISIIDVDAPALIGVIDISPFAAPHDLEYSAATGLLYAGVEMNEDGDNGVVIIDPQSRAVVDHVATEGKNCHWLALSNDATKCYVAHKEAEFVSVLDLAGRRLLGRIDLPGGAEEIDLSADGRSIFVASPTVPGGTPPSAVGNSRLVKIDVELGEIIGELELEPVNSAVRATSDGRVLVTQLSHLTERGMLRVVDTATMSLLASVELGKNPFTIRVSPDSSKAYVTNAGSGTVSEVDLSTYEVTMTLQGTPAQAPYGTHPLCLMPSV